MELTLSFFAAFKISLLSLNFCKDCIIGNSCLLQGLAVCDMIALYEKFCESAITDWFGTEESYEMGEIQN